MIENKGLKKMQEIFAGRRNKMSKDNLEKEVLEEFDEKIGTFKNGLCLWDIIDKKFVDNFLKQTISKVKQAERERVVEIVRSEFYKLEEIEKDFNTNQDIIRSRNNLISKIKELE